MQYRQGQYTISIGRHHAAFSSPWVALSSSFPEIGWLLESHGLMCQGKKQENDSEEKERCMRLFRHSSQILLSDFIDLIILIDILILNDLIH